MLFEHGVPFRPDWEAVLTPVVDTLAARSDVDSEALTAYGISQGGFWLPRALAFEHRFVAAVADPGVVDVSTSWLAHLPEQLVALLDSGQKELFNHYMSTVDADPAMARTFAFRARPYGITDPFELFTAVRGYQLRDVAGDIRTPLLITDPDDEQFWPGQPAELAGLLNAPHELAAFTRADGANFHCEPLAPRQLTARMFGWLGGYVLKAAAHSRPARVRTGTTRRVSINGKVVAEDPSNGQYAVVTCSGERLTQTRGQEAAAIPGSYRSRAGDLRRPVWPRSPNARAVRRQPRSAHKPPERRRRKCRTGLNRPRSFRNERTDHVHHGLLSRRRISSA
jgi:hypothetical protein